MLPAVSSGDGFVGAVEARLLSAKTRDPGPWVRPALDRSRWVYFIRGGDMIKIGTAKCVRSRLAELQVGSPVILELLLAIPGSRDLERHLHIQHQALRAHGEWFRAEGPLLNHIERIRDRRGSR
jgi:hypothetical protein